MLNEIKTKTLWAPTDKLSTNKVIAEYKHLVFGLNFIKYTSDVFLARKTEPEVHAYHPIKTGEL